MKIVLDANIYVSSLLTQRGNARQIFDLWKDGYYELLVTKEILAEVARVLRYPHIAKIHKQSERDIDRFIKLLATQATLVKPAEKLSVATDESDNRYIECAVEGGATYLVTGDKKHLLPIKSYNSIGIISPATFLIVLGLKKM